MQRLEYSGEEQPEEEEKEFEEEGEELWKDGKCEGRVIGLKINNNRRKN